MPKVSEKIFFQICRLILLSLEFLMSLSSSVFQLDQNWNRNRTLFCFFCFILMPFKCRRSLRSGIYLGERRLNIRWIGMFIRTYICRNMYVDMYIYVYSTWNHFKHSLVTNQIHIHFDFTVCCSFNFFLSLKSLELNVSTRVCDFLWSY